MNIQVSGPSRHIRSVSAKAAYSRAARKKLVDYKVKLDGVRAAIQHEIATEKSGSRRKLECSRRAMETRIAAAEVRLALLQKSGEEDWEGHRQKLEDAWEDLSHSINKIIARIKDTAT